jgi:hypothetical protein
MNRAVGAHLVVANVTWGVAPCWYEAGLWPKFAATPRGQRQRRDLIPARGNAPGIGSQTRQGLKARFINLLPCLTAIQREGPRDAIGHSSFVIL